MTGLAVPGLVPTGRPAGLFAHEPPKDEVEHLKLKSFADWPDAAPPERDGWSKG